MIRWSNYNSRHYRSRDQSSAGYSGHAPRWGLKTDNADSDLSWLNNVPMEGLLSIYR